MGFVKAFVLMCGYLEMDVLLLGTKVGCCQAICPIHPLQAVLP